MSNKWTIIGTNALESWNPEYNIKDPKEKAKIHSKRKYKFFKNGMKINKMQIIKPKKVLKDNAEVDSM